MPRPSSTTEQEPSTPDPHHDLRREARHHLVDRVVDALVDEVVERVEAGSAHVHAWSLADRLEALEDLDRLGGVGVAAGGRVGLGGVGHASLRG